MADEPLSQSKEELRAKRIKNLIPYKKGQSGNPGGRSKEKPVTQLLRELFDNPEDFLMIANQMRGVFKGKSGMAKVMLLKDAAERLEGKITQPVDVNGDVFLTLAERMKKARERRNTK